MIAKGKKQLEMALNKAIMIARKTEATIVIQGESGIGKTHIIRKIALEKNWDLVTRVLSNATIEEIVGVPVIQEVNGSKVFNKIIPQWIQPVYETGTEKPLILFLDEINRRVIPEQVLFSILDKKLVAGKQFRSNVILIACINTGKHYNVQDLEDRAILNRLIVIEFSMIREDLLKMIEEFGKLENNNALAILLNSLINKIPRCFGEFNQDYISLRNWKNLFYYLQGMKVSSLNKLTHIFESDDFLNYIICPEIIDDVRHQMHQLVSNTSELINNSYKKGEKLPVEQQFEAQVYFMSRIINGNRESLEKSIKMMSMVMDNGLILGILKEIMPVLETDYPGKKAQVISVLNKLNIIQKVKSAF